MLSIIDKYIIRKFLSTFFFSVFLIICIAIVIDLSEKIDDFIENKATTKQIIFDYYLFFIPSFYNLFNNLFVFIAVIFFTSKMAGNSEIVAMLSSGISFRRLLRPYFIAAIVLGSISFLLNSWLIPYCDKKKVDFENAYINGRKNVDTWRNNVHRQLQPGEFMYIDNFVIKDSLGYRFTLERFVELKLVYKLSADKLMWSVDSASWAVVNYVERTMYPKRTFEKGDKKLIALKFNPEEFFMRKEDAGIFNNKQLKELIANERMRGAEQVEYYLLESYRRSAMPFSTLVLTLIAFSVSSRKTRGGVGLHIGFGLALAFSFIFLSEMTRTFSHSGSLPPWLAIWIPIFVYALIGLYLFNKAPK